MISRYFTVRTLIYIAAVAVLTVGFAYGQLAKAQSGTWESCNLTWFGMLIGPAECGSPPPGSECYSGCSMCGSGICWCPTSYCWSVFVPTAPPACPTQGQACGPSAPNSCGMTGSGTVDASCNCTATTPSDALCPSPSCSNGSAGPYPACPLASCDMFPGHIGTYPYCFTPDACSASNSCGMTNWGTRTDYAGNCSASAPSESLCAPGDPGPGPTPAVSCSVAPPSVTTLPGSVTYSANPSGGAGGPYTWDDSQSGSYGSSATQARSWSSGATPGSYVMRVKASNTGWSSCPSVAVSNSGGSCSGAGPLTAAATPNRINDSSTLVRLTWSSPDVNAASCTVTNLTTSAVVGNSPVSSCSTSGSADVSGITAQTTYRVTCGSLFKDVVVNVVPKYEEF